MFNAVMLSAAVQFLLNRHDERVRPFDPVSADEALAQHDLIETQIVQGVPPEDGPTVMEQRLAAAVEQHLASRFDSIETMFDALHANAEGTNQALAELAIRVKTLESPVAPNAGT